MMNQFLLAATLLLMLPACTLSDLADKPPQLFELKAMPQAMAGAPSPLQLLVDIPQASAGIDTARIAVQQADGGVTYYKDVSWTDAAPNMLQTLMLAVFEGSNRLPAVARQNSILRADYILKSDLRQFSYNSSTGTVRVEVQASLIEMPRRTIAATQGFKAEQKAESGDIRAIIAAYQLAANQVVGQLVEWSLSTLPAKRREKQVSG